MPDEPVQRQSRGQMTKREYLYNWYAKEKGMDATEFWEMVQNHPSPKRILESTICGVPISLSEYESFQLNEASPFDLETVTAYNSAYVHKEAAAYAPKSPTAQWGKWIVFLLMAVILVPVGLYIANNLL